MFRPERVVRAVVIGMKNDEMKVVSALYSLGCVQIIEYSDEEEGFSRGKPGKGISELSEKVIILRTLIRELELEDGSITPLSRGKLFQEMNEKFDTLRKEVLSVLKEKEMIETELKDITRKKEEYIPFQMLGLDLAAYKQYKTLCVFVGIVSKDISQEIRKNLPLSYLRSVRSDAGFYICVFAPKEDSETLSSILSQNGFQDIPIPGGEGNPSKVVSELEEKINNLSIRLENSNRKIQSLREKYRLDILALEEMLSEEVEKLEAPLRICASKNTFVADLWVPANAYPLVNKTVAEVSEGRAVCLRVKKKISEEEPVIMRNPQVFTPFEAMVKLFSPPKYDELDPTILVSIFFPLFFGIMVSDVGFGVMLTIIGALFLSGKTLGLEKIVSGNGLKHIGSILCYGGAVGAILGLFIFGEMFGIPFESAHEGELAWGIPLLFPGVHIEKFQNIGDLLILAIVFAGIHLGIGMCLGIVNKYKHEKKHAVGKVGWLFVVIGVVTVILVSASEMGNRLSGVIVSSLLWPLKSITFQFGPMHIPTIPVMLAIIGLSVAAVGEGGIALIEIFTVGSNIFSYARIAAIGLAEAGIHFGFNLMLIPTIISGYTHPTPESIALSVIMVFFLIMAQMLAFMLGSLSAGIQSLRLHFFEFFTKFYEGGGTEFTPFGRRLKYLKEV